MLVSILDAGINIRLVKAELTSGTSPTLTLELTADNQGARADSIAKVTIPGPDIEFSSATDADGTCDTYNIPANTTTTITCGPASVSGLAVGQNITIRVQLQSGTVLTHSVTVESAS